MAYIPTLFSPVTMVPSILPVTYLYSILGVSVAVTSDLPETLERINERYGAFRDESATSRRTLILQLRCSGEDATFLVSDSQGNVRPWSNPHLATRDLLDRMDHQVLARLQRQGIYAIQASAMTYDDGAVMLAGRSGCGKTTLVLGLLRRGLRLLSDECTLVEPTTHLLLPYRRSIHVRPGTFELIPELHFLQHMQPQRLRGGAEWSLTPHVLEHAFPNSLGSATPLRAMLLLDGVPRFASRPMITPMSTALATMELLRGTWATSMDFVGRLGHVSQLLDNAHCARLHVGALEATLDCIVSWLRAYRD